MMEIAIILIGGIGMFLLVVCLGLHFMGFGASLIDLLFGGLDRWKPSEYFHYVNEMIVDIFSWRTWKEIYYTMQYEDKVIK